MTCLVRLHCRWVRGVTISVTFVHGGLFLCEHQYVIDLLSQTNMADAKLVGSPMATNGSLILHNGSPTTDAKEYHRVIRSLHYLSFTRPDIAYVVN